MRKDAGKEEYLQFYQDNHIPMEEGARFAGEIRTWFVRTGEIDAQDGIDKRSYQEIIKDPIFKSCHEALNHASIALQTVFMYHYDWGYEFKLAELEGIHTKKYIKRY